VSGDGRYGVDDLADLLNREVRDPRDEVSRRTIRYFVQEGLLQEPYGLGRGKHYGPEHLQRLREIRDLQKKGLSLSEVRDWLARSGRPKAAAEVARDAVVQRPASAWTRVEVLPGVELHVSGRYRAPSARRLEELAEWCRQSLRTRTADEEE
jgi:DNA-binding transcriptional MerR regulator